MANSLGNEKSKMKNEKTVTGAAPAGATDPGSAAGAVRRMFSDIAPRYDLANHVLSMNVDRLWWWRTARTFTHILRNPDSRVLDLCCGTGDMTFALARRAGLDRPRTSGLTRMLGADFAHPMLVRAAEKSAGKAIAWLEADALQLPFPGASFDLVTSAFGFRNLADYDAGLREIARVLRQGREVGILDFGDPKGLFGVAYHFYFRHVLPKIGTMISGVRGPYAYLPASVARFPSPDEMLIRMRAAGFADVSWTPYTFGIAGLYRGKKA
jgi:demethylmenaquinone methyltransferase/2-methoxy-6-polyprenyl-1,4-benzoquinol methylase